MTELLASSVQLEGIGFMVRGIEGIFSLVGVVAGSFLVTGVIAAIGSAVLARAKGYSAPLFAVLGFLFSILTLIVVLLLPTKEVIASPAGGVNPGGASTTPH